MNETKKEKIYLTVKNKLQLSLLFSTLWLLLCTIIAIPWYNDLCEIYHPVWAASLIAGIALIPGFFNIFLTSALLFDKRPKYKDADLHIENLQPITILVAAYNEEDALTDTLESIKRQQYPREVEVIVCDDGSTDKTVEVFNNFKSKFTEENPTSNISFDISTGFPNVGKSGALNRGLELATHDIIVTVDADSWVFKNGLINLISNLINGPKNTVAVAGSILVRNSRKNWLTKLQEWEYAHAISVVKKTQSLFQGTLVAQGAFSAYLKSALKEMNGWPHVVGEDIVLTWGLMSKGYRIGHAENAIAFTNVPEKYKVFFNQRRRWSRGLIEAFKRYPSSIWTIRQNSIFIWMNMLFPFLDFMFLFGFVPGVIFALGFQMYAIVSLLTVTLIPAAILLNYVIYRVQIKVFDEMGLKFRKNFFGFALYVLVCQLIIVSACLRGYLDELIKAQKTWGTKNSTIKNEKK